MKLQAQARWIHYPLATERGNLAHPPLPHSASTSGFAIFLPLQRAEGDARRHLLVPFSGLSGRLTSKLIHE